MDGNSGQHGGQGEPSPMPRAVQLSLAAGTLLLAAGGLFLLAVRGDAMLLDLYAAGKMLLCF